MRLPIFAALLLATACEPAVTSTYVSGTVMGVSFSGPSAISHKGGSTIFDNDIVLITSVGSACSATTFTGVGGPDGVSDSSGTRVAALILQGSGMAFLDRGGNTARVTSTAANIKYVEDRSDGTRLGRFDVDFGSEKFVGDFVAPPCAGLSSGCDATGVGVLPALALLVWARLGRRRPLSRRSENGRPH